MDYTRTASGRIFLGLDGIEVWAVTDNHVTGESGKLMVGDSWRIGAVDKELYPYEVLIVVVNRRA